MKNLIKLLPAAAFAFSSLLGATVLSRSNDIVVLQSNDLPRLAQAAGQSMMLRSLGNGLTYLYIEQQPLGRIAILDVTDPARIKAVGAVGLQVPAEFDFDSAASGYTVLLRYRDGKGMALLDLKKPNRPSLVPISDSMQGANAEMIGRSSFFLTGGWPGGNALPDWHDAARDYKVIDSSAAQNLRLLATVRQVHQTLTKDDTGTIFLLGEDGLTVVRQPSVELRNRLESTYSS